MSTVNQALRLAKRLGRRFALALIDKRLPRATVRDLRILDNLLKDLRELPELRIQDLKPSEASWIENEVTLREMVLSGDPREFLRWDVIRRTMVVHSPSWLATEFKYLKRHQDWQLRWRRAIEETPVGHPRPYWRHRHSSGNLIHTAYSAAKFEEKTGFALNEFHTVIEFGGGYGSMCRLIHNIGFAGKYLIYDLPMFSALQRFYLETIGLDVARGESSKLTDRGVWCVSEVDSLKALLPAAPERRKAIFIATWSLSETPIELRGHILSLMSGFGAYLISSQSHYKEVDNIEYFKQWQAAQPDVDWHTWTIGHQGKNFYVMGSRR